jgi:hypothetical protein
MAFDQDEIFIVPLLLWHRTSVFPVSSEGPPHLVPSSTRKEMWRTCCNPDYHGSCVMWKFGIMKCLNKQIKSTCIYWSTFLFIISKTCMWIKEL